MLFRSYFRYFPAGNFAFSAFREPQINNAQWDEKAKDLAGRFIKNFTKFTGNEAGKKLVAAGPKL